MFKRMIMVRHALLALILSAGLTISIASAEQAPEIVNHNAHNQLPEQGSSTLTWEELSNLDIRVETPAPLQSIFHVSFPEAIQAKAGQQVKIEGFMYPLKAGEMHDYFLLSAFPPSCPFCLPGGQTTLIEVNCQEPVEYTLESIVIQGTFSLSKDDPSGLYYRLSEAQLAAN